MSHAEHEATSRPLPPGRRRLIFALVSTPVAWLLHETISLAIVGRACGEGMSSAKWGGLIAVSLLALITALFGITNGLRAFRMRSPKASLLKAEGWDLVQFLALFAVFLGFFLLLNILYFGILPFLVEPCLRSF